MLQALKVQRAKPCDTRSSGKNAAQIQTRVATIATPLPKVKSSQGRHRLIVQQAPFSPSWTKKSPSLARRSLPRASACGVDKTPTAQAGARSVGSGPNAGSGV